MSTDNTLHIMIGAERHGWSTVTFLGNRAPIILGISHVFSDPLQDLVNLALGLLERKDRIEFSLYDEPGGHHIAFRKIVDAPTNYELDVSDLNSDYGQCLKVGKSILHTIVDPRYIVVQIYGEIQKIQMCMKYTDFSVDRKHMSIPDNFRELEKRLTNR